MKLKLSILLGMLSLGCWHTVPPGHVGVKVCWGTLERSVWGEGWFWEGTCDFHNMSVRTQAYTMSGNDSIRVLTRDQLAVVMEVSVQFHLNGAHAVAVYRLLGDGYADTIVHPLVRTAVRDAASGFQAIALVDERARLQEVMQTLMRGRLAETLGSRQINARAIVIDDILLRNIDLPDSLEASIAGVQQQRQQTAQQEQARLTAEQRAQRLRIEAEGDATSMLVRTRADIEAQRLRAEATAAANRTLAQSLTPEILRLRQIEAMSAVLANEHTRTIFVPVGTSPTIMMSQGTP